MPEPMVDHVPAVPIAEPPTAAVRSNGVAPGAPPTVDSSPAPGGLAERLQELKALYETVASRTADAARVMSGHGPAPDYTLVEALGDCHRRFLRLRGDVIRGAAEAGLAVPDRASLRGPNDLGTLIESIVSALESATNSCESPPASQTIPPEEAPTFVSITVEQESPEPAPREEANSDVVARETHDEGEFNTVSPPRAEPEPVALVSAPPPEVSPESAVAFAPLPDAPVAEISPQPAEETSTPLREVAEVDPGRAAVRDLLDAVCRIRTSDGAAFPPLEGVIEKATDLRIALDGGSGELSDGELALLARGDHPLNSLVAVINEVQGLSDAEWAEHHARASEAFGRQVAVAAARGKFRLPGANGD
jgi:hypothetical protein